MGGPGLPRGAGRKSWQFLGFRESILRAEKLRIYREGAAHCHCSSKGRESAGTAVELGIANLAGRRTARDGRTAIRIGNPRSWKKALQAVDLTGGFVLDVTDEEIGEAKAVIGRDGIGCEPASATTLAGIRKLTGTGKIDRDALVVAVLTGHALKDTDYIIKAQQRLESGETVAVPVC